MDGAGLDPRAVDRVKGPAWEPIRPLFAELNDLLLAASSSATGELTTIYVKYSSAQTSGWPYAVVWLKKAREIVVGLALPDGCQFDGLGDEPPGHKYAGLTRFAVFKPGDNLPSRMTEWIKVAHATASRAES